MAVPLFTAFGTRVKVHWSLLVFMAFLAFEAGELVPALQWAALLFAAVLIHEFGHVAAARRAGLFAPEIWLTPLGGTAHLVGEFPSWKDEALVAVAGPATSVLALGAAAAISYVAYDEPFPWTWLGFFGTINGALALFNSLPAYPLDGGVVLRAFLSSRRGRLSADRTAAFLGQLFAVGFVVVGVVRLVERERWGWILIAIGISNFLACRRLRGFAGTTGPGLWSRLKAAGERRRRERGRKVERRVDELLEKVGRDGLSSLSRREKKFLKKASELYRERQED